MRSSIPDPEEAKTDKILLLRKDAAMRRRHCQSRLVQTHPTRTCSNALRSEKEPRVVQEKAGKRRVKIQTLIQITTNNTGHLQGPNLPKSPTLTT
jgi:hypothetical protein